MASLCEHLCGTGLLLPLAAKQMWERLPTDPSPFLRLNCYNPGASLQKTQICHPPAAVPKPGYLLEKSNKLWKTPTPSTTLSDADVLVY